MSLAEVPSTTIHNLSEADVGLDQDESVDAFEEIKARILDQHKTYLKRESSGELTLYWRRYESRHSEEINLLRKKGLKMKLVFDKIP